MQVLSELARKGASLVQEALSLCCHIVPLHDERWGLLRE